MGQTEWQNDRQNDRMTDTGRYGGAPHLKRKKKYNPFLTNFGALYLTQFLTDFGQILDSKSYYEVFKYASMQVCEYSSMQLCKYASMHVCKYASMHICKYAHMHICTYAIMHIYASMQVCTTLLKPLNKKLI